MEYMIDDNSCIYVILYTLSIVTDLYVFSIMIAYQYSLLGVSQPIPRIPKYKLPIIATTG